MKDKIKCYCGPNEETTKKEKIMSTTFGIPQRAVDFRILIDEFGDIQDYVDKNFFEPVFFRTSHNSRWLNPLGDRLPNNTLVFPLDNDAQGIYTIGDIKQLLNKQNETNP